MAIWNSKEFLSTKYTTAVIIDKNNRSYSIDIKNTIDDYFMVTISKQRYVFRLDAKIYTWRQMGRKTCRWMLYTTDHYLPLSVQDCKELEIVLRENNLPKVDEKMFDLFKLLGKREKHATDADKDQMFKEHDLTEIVDLVAKEQSNYPEIAENLKTYFQRLSISKIITPVRHLSEMLDSELKTTDAKIFGDLEEQVKRTDKERKAMSNNVKDAKKNWLVIGILGLLIGGGVIFALYAYSTGAFDHIVPTIGPTSTAGPPKNLNDFAQKYPTPEKLQAALDSGEIKMSDVPQAGKDMLKNYKRPVATPVQ